MVVVRGGRIDILSPYIHCCCGLVINIVLHYFQINIQDKKIITNKPEFFDFLKAEAIKNRFNKKQPTLLTQQLKNAPEELYNHPNITIKN